MPSPLAIHGGKPAVPPGTFQPSPQATAVDEAMVLQSLRSGSHAWGENCEALQREWAAWNGNDHCIAVNSGTASLQMCLAACGVGAGDEVITPAFSWTSSASCVLHQKAIPVFVDVDPTLANVDAHKIEPAITPGTKAILVVHLHGVPADMDPILDVARRHGLPIIEDACQAHGAQYKGRKVGTLADCAGFSLNQNKMLSAGEGGLFVTDDKRRVERARSLALFGDFREWGTVQQSNSPADGSEICDGCPAYGMGYMYRYNELCAAYARAQLQQLDASIDHARGLFAILREELAHIPGLILPAEPAYARENGYNFVCHVDPEAIEYTGPVNFLREAVVRAIQAEGVPCMVWQRRILPEFAPIAARNAYGKGSPWREHGSTVDYDPSQFPNALYHSASYFILSDLRRPNGAEAARLAAAGVRKVFENISHLDIDALAQGADMSLYERGWRPRSTT